MSINNEFLKEFKKLDKLLSDAYGEIHGVTAYINEMKNVGVNNCEDFIRLKNLRNVRNKLIHEVGYENIARVNKSDIAYLKQFYQRFLNRKDPLAQLHKNKKQKHKVLYIVAIVFVILLFSIIAGVLINSYL